MIFLVRHGQTEMNLQGRLQGRGDAPLTADGRVFASRTARILADRIGKEETVIYSSPLGRARETARIIAEELSGPRDVVLDDRLAELDLGLWDGLTVAEIDQGWPGSRQKPPPGEWFFLAPEGESYEEFRQRIASFFDDLGGSGARFPILVSHGLSGRIIRGLHAGLSREEMVNLPVPGDACFILREGDRIEELRIT